MPVFICSKCNMMENTATSNYWHRDLDLDRPENSPPKTPSPPLCSQCDPTLGKWHGLFQREPMPPDHVIGPDGFVWHKDEPYLKRQLEEKKKGPTP